jgi:glycosyltransferase involved in cell wall biosynthesis
MAERAIHVVVNGRFAGQKITGVQRYAHEVSRRFGDRVSVVAPSRPLAGFAGHLWEQFILPARVPRHSLLWSPANTGPLAVSNQIVTVHDTSVFDHPEWFSFLFRIGYRTLLPTLIQRTRAVLTDSEFSRQRILTRFALPAERVIAIPSGVDLDHFRPCDPLPMREKYRLPDRYALFVGSIEPRKNLPRLLRAWQKVQKTSDTQLIIAGSTGKVFNKIQWQGGLEEFIFLGYVPDSDLPELYSGATVFILPSLSEGFGLTVLEAMACGTPVVCASSGALPEVTGDAGLLVDPFSVDAIAEALTKILSDENLRQTLRQKGLERARQFSWQKTASMIWDVFQGIQ